MVVEISEAHAREFRSHGGAVVEAYLESKGWRRQLGGGPRNVWYLQELARDLCPSCDDPDGPVEEDTYCGSHDGAAWVLLWPCGAGAGPHDVLHTLCQVEGRGPGEILRALSLRDRDEVRAMSDTPLWQVTCTPEDGSNFFWTLDRVLALTTGEETVLSGEEPCPYSAQLVSENEVLFAFPHEEELAGEGSPFLGREAAQHLHSTAQRAVRPSNRATHVAKRYATGEWTTVQVLGPEDWGPGTPLERHVTSLVHEFGLTTWMFDRSLPLPRHTGRSRST